MSADTSQDSELEQLLADTAVLRRQYRAASQEEPSAPLDEAIRAAARRDVRARPHPAGSRLGTSWHIPASIAAVLVVSVTLTVMVAQHDTQLPVTREQPAPALGAGAARDQAEAAPASGALKAKAQPEPAKRAVQAPPQAAGPPASSEAPTATAVEKLERSMVPEAKQVREAKKPIAPTGMELRVEPSPARAPAEAASPAPAAAANSIPAPPTLQEGAAKPTAEGTVSAPPLAKRWTQAGPAEADSSGSPWEKDPQAWLAHIEELRAAGRSEDAAVSFRAFRSRYPDYRLPAGFVAPGP